MGGFPQIVEFFSKIKVETARISNKGKLCIAVLVSAGVAIFYLAYSQPVFYAQGYDMSYVGPQADIAILADLNNSDFVSEQDELLNSTPKTDISRGIFVSKTSELENELYEMVGDYPIKEMVPYIAKKDKRVAAFIVGIAKKESNWGKRVPTKNGQDCFNYWGYKGAGENGIAMGHGCFATPEEAVNVIARRLEQLVGKNLTTPSKMVVWKCGSSCAAHDPKAVKKWISDIDIYFNKIVALKG